MSIDPDKDLLALPHGKIFGERVMRMSSRLVAPSAVVILSAALLLGLGGAAMSQTAPNSTLPGVAVESPKQTARPPQSQERAANTGAAHRRGPAPRTTAQTATRTPPPAPGSVLAKLKELERTSSNCTDGCQSSFKYGNQPWNGCSTTGDIFSATCRNVRGFKTYADCQEHGLITGWHRNGIWWYCSSLMAGGKLAGEKVQVAELKRSGRRQ